MAMRGGFVIALTALLTAACTSVQAADAVLTAKEFDMQIRYTASVQEGKAMVRGSVKNVRFARMEDLEITVSALDADGTLLGQKRELLIPVSLPMDEEAAFSVEFQLKPEKKPSDLRFLYRYRPNEGERDEPLQMRSITAPFDAAAASSAPR